MREPHGVSLGRTGVLKNMKEMWSRRDAGRRGGHWFPCQSETHGAEKVNNFSGRNLQMYSLQAAARQSENRETVK